MRKGTRDEAVSVEEMRSEKEVIEKISIIFERDYKAEAYRKKGVMDNHTVDKLMNKSIETYKKKNPLTKEQEEIVQGYYDTYMAMLFYQFHDINATAFYMKTLVEDEINITHINY